MPRTPTPPTRRTRQPAIDPRIATARRVVAVPVAELRVWDRNPHEGDVSALRQSLARFGQVTPIVRAPEGWIIAGNHTFKALVEEGFTHAACVTLEAAEAEQIAFGLASNRTGALGVDDDRQVLALLSELQVLDGTGYTVDDVADLQALMEELDRPRLRSEGASGYEGVNRLTGIADDEPSMTERLGEYQLHNIRSMVLDYPVETFAWVAAQAERARAELSVDTNSALLVALLANLLGEQAPS